MKEARPAASVLYWDAGMSAPWHIRAKSEKIKSRFKIKYGRVFADLWAPGVHGLYLYISLGLEMDLF